MSTSFASTGSLRPILAQSSGRYEVGKKPSIRDAPPADLPQNWSSYIHPEGKTYFCRKSGLSVVTNCNVYNPAIGEQICFWASVAEKEANSRGFVLTNDVELFLKLDGEDCNYYFIDRATKSLFWLEEYETCDIGLHSTISASHLKIVLEAEYWAHTENFCMHFGGLPQKDMDDLIIVFSHALADNLTSSSSTFPYDATACEKFLNLLTTSRDRIHEAFTITFVARLWSVVAYNRYEIHYGQEHARLSRDSSILVNENTEPKWAQNVVSLYDCDWNTSTTGSVKGWRNTSARSATSNKNVDMFNKASNFTMNQPKIVNAGGDVVTNHHHSYSFPAMQGLQEQVHQLVDKVETLVNAFTARNGNGNNNRRGITVTLVVGQCPGHSVKAIYVYARISTEDNLE